MPTPAEVIPIAEVSQYLAGNTLEAGGLYGGGAIYKKLERRLYVERKSLEWKYSYDPTNTTDLVATSNYVYALCAPFSLLAKVIINGGTGGLLAAVMLEISGADFENMNEYTNPILNGKNIKVFSNGIARFLYNENPPTGYSQEWLLNGSTLQILTPGFDSATIDYHLFVVVVGSISSSSSGGGGALNETISFSNLDTYTLPWTSRASIYGTFGVFNVLQDYNDGNGFQPTAIQPSADNGTAPTQYTFTGLGNFATRITIT